MILECWCELAPAQHYVQPSWLPILQFKLSREFHPVVIHWGERGERMKCLLCHCVPISLYICQNIACTYLKDGVLLWLHHPHFVILTKPSNSTLASDFAFEKTVKTVYSFPVKTVKRNRRFSPQLVVDIKLFEVICSLIKEYVWFNNWIIVCKSLYIRFQADRRQKGYYTVNFHNFHDEHSQDLNKINDLVRFPKKSPPSL